MKKLMLTLFFMCIAVSAFSQDRKVSWYKADGADSYAVFWNDSTGENEGTSGEITGTTFTVKDLPNTEYFFTVIAYNYCGHASGPSEALSSCDIEAPVGIPPGFKFETIVTVKVEINGIPEALVKTGD